MFSTRALVLFTAAALMMIIPGLLMSCQSRFHEPSPGAVSPTGPTSEENVREKVAMDSRLDEIQRSAKRIQELLAATRKVMRGADEKGTYTPIDFLVQVNEKAKATIPVRENEKQVRLTTLDLPVGLLTTDCKTVHVKSELTRVIEEDKEKKVKKVVEEIVEYSMKSCATDARFSPVIRARSANDSFSFEILADESFEKMFEKILIKGLKPESGCKITEKNTSIDRIECKDLLFGLSSTASVLVKEFGFRNADDVQFSAQYEIYNAGKLYCSGNATLFRNGRSPVLSHCDGIK